MEDLMDPWSQVGNSIAQGFYIGQERRDKKKMLEEEYAQRLKILQQQAKLDAAQPTNEIKLAEWASKYPEQFGNLRKAMDPYGAQELALKDKQLQLQGQNYQSEAAYRNAQIANMGKADAPSRVREAQYWATQINPKTGRLYTTDEIQQFLYKPPFSFDFGMGGGGGDDPQFGAK